MSERIHLEAYSIGIAFMSICTNVEDKEEIERLANTKYPTGTEGKWKISENTHFAGGQTNPCDCDNGNGKHYLMEC